jgi:cell division protein FtsA
MAKPAVITAIDLGTDKCVTLIASLDPETKGLSVLGVAASTSRGVRKSQIVDLEQVQETITESLDAAERMAGLEVGSAYFSLSGAHIASQNSKGVVAVAAPNQEITSEDVARVIEAARAISMPADREVLHVIPHDFTVDAQTGIKDPVGMTGIRLETETHIITGMSTALRNLTKCAHDLGIEVDGVIFSGLAASEVVLTETEKELGVVLIDIGAGSTAVCAYVEGALTYSAVFPVGARHITQDIALGCRVSLDSAEKIKLALSQEMLSEINRPPVDSKESLAKRKKLDEKLDVSKLGLSEQLENLSKKTLVEGIMVPRIKEIFVLIGKELQKNGLFPLVPAGLVLTGGGAETIGMVEVAKRTLNLPARIGKPMALQGMIEDIHKPSFATSIGLLYYAKQRGGGKIASKGLSIKLPSSISEITKPIINFFKSLIP